MAVTTRERIVEAGAMLFRRQGWSGTGMKQIAAAAAAPFGSIYHFFPGGKDELSAEVDPRGRTCGLWPVDLSVLRRRAGSRDRHAQRIPRGGGDAAQQRFRRCLPDRDRGARGRQHQ